MWYRIIMLLLILSTFNTLAQNPYPLTKDVSTLDGIIKAYYEVVSGPTGPKQTERDKSLHHPMANVVVTGITLTGEPFVRSMSLKEFHLNVPADAFYESEIHRIVETFGNITHVWSTYESRDQLNGPVTGRGINSIQLYHDKDRWWILNWAYDSERNSNPLPEKYLPEEKK